MPLGMWNLISDGYTILSSHCLHRSVRLYSLQSVIEHMGGPSSGHYATYRKVVERRTSQWVHLSDTAVYNVDVKDVLDATAYMLFYEKVV